MYMIKKWKIEMLWDNDNHPLVFYIHDDHFSNVLSKLREFSFPIDPNHVKISIVTFDELQVTYTTDVNNSRTANLNTQITTGVH